ncbi:PREDICTED: ATP-dependent 6-phosphofructokinase 6-like isoform X1 [Populus euphratica]|uniref:ATP-dependent 6-phosphofructokinase 6-like isoform X1 n=1 Tax=Populus euphratica TaxID=75702 RepID=A0AAJ6XPQ0_POPEU|nr:PREDICTED: ATP-dependent 6-phosphofructokinase 6-like isoform X1 [Populus euphratica]
MHLDDGFVLEVVPHLIDFPSNLPADFCWTRRCSCKQIVVHKDSPRGVHFRRAGPRDNYTGGLGGACASSLAYGWDPLYGHNTWRSMDLYFKPEEVRACIVTCGGLCPGLNTVILWSW